MTHEYRLYYNDDGSLICYSMEKLPHKFIVIDAKTYSEAPILIRVVDEKLIRLQRSRITSVYEKNSKGVKTSKYDINILVDDTPHHYWSLNAYDDTNTRT